MSELGKKMQTEFFQSIKSKLSERTSLVDIVCSTLGLSTDSSYRRIRGETFLTVNEIAILSAEFKVAFNEQIQFDEHRVSFDYYQLQKSEDRFQNWLEGINNDLHEMIYMQEVHITFAAEDVPIWHHFNSAKLIAFKFFYWMKTIMNVPSLEGKKFDIALVNPKLIDLAGSINQYYQEIPSTEIWTEDTINSTIKQVEFFWGLGYFKTEADALEICDLIEKEIDILFDAASTGFKKSVKKKQVPYRMYLSDLMVGNNSILVKTKEGRVSYVVKNTFHTMTTHNPEYTAENEEWLLNIISKSILISGSNEKQRLTFFKLLRQKVAKLRAFIQS